MSTVFSVDPAMPSVASASVGSPVVGTFSSTSLFFVSFSTKEIKHVNYEKKKKIFYKNLSL